MLYSRRKAVARFDALVNKRANERNRLLYATAEGIPRMVGGVRETLDETKQRVSLELVLFLLIDTVKVQQQFVVQGPRCVRASDETHSRQCSGR